jgi:hypothetical protein
MIVQVKGTEYVKKVKRPLTIFSPGRRGSKTEFYIDQICEIVKIELRGRMKARKSIDIIFKETEE